MKAEDMDAAEVFKCSICGKFTAWKDGADDDMPDACSACWSLGMLNNEAWTPFVEAVKDCKSTPLGDFIADYPPRLRPAVALALSLAKWYLMVSNDPFFAPGRVSCGCCALHGDCEGCSLHTGQHFCVGSDTCEGIYARIHRIYTKHFNALPARDRQKARKQ